MINVNIAKNDNLIYSAALLILNNPAKYNPLFLYGKSLTNKTKILKLIVKSFKQIYKKSSIYTKADDFLCDFIFSLKLNKVGQFTQKYRNNALFAIDNIQVLADKEYTQQQMIMTLKELEHKGSQIVISANCHPDDINGLDEDLKSYCYGGLMIEI